MLPELFFVPGIVCLTHMLFLLGKMHTRIIFQKLKDIVYLRPAAMLLDREHEIIDPLEQLSVLAVDGGYAVAVNHSIPFFPSARPPLRAVRNCFTAERY